MNDITEKLEKPQTVMPFGQWQILRQQAEIMIKSKFLPNSLNTAEKVISVMLAGRELGIGPMAALRNIYPINGVPTIAPRLMLALAIKKGDLESWGIEEFPDRVIFKAKRKGNAMTHAAEFGDKDAAAMQLLSKDNYKKQKITMYKWRAISKGLAFLFPDVLMGMYTPEEMGADVIVSDGDELDIKGVSSPDDKQKEAAEGAKLKAAEIIAGLSQIHNANAEAMAEELKALTTYKTEGGEQWIELDDLLKLALEKPSWVERIYQKVMPEINKRLEKEEAVIETVTEI